MKRYCLFWQQQKERERNEYSRWGRFRITTITAEITSITDQGFGRMENFCIAHFFGMHVCERYTFGFFLSQADLLLFIFRLFYSKTDVNIRHTEAIHEQSSLKN